MEGLKLHDVIKQYDSGLHACTSAPTRARLAQCRSMFEAIQTCEIEGNNTTLPASWRLVQARSREGSAVRLSNLTIITLVFGAGAAN